MSHPGDSLMGIIVSIYNLGCFTGCVINFAIGNWLGRRRAMWLAMAWIIVSPRPDPQSPARLPQACPSLDSPE